jgi:ParB family chromosome partitioning protein
MTKNAPSALQTLPMEASDVVHIPLSDLRRSRRNVRKVKVGKETIAQLAASILSLGLLQNLVVIAPADEGGAFEVIGGDRRLSALFLLLKRKKIAGDYSVPCKVVASEAATAASLTENFQRERMHAADEFEAFQAMREQGMTVESIAETFGVAVSTVLRRLKLASLHPMFIKMFRAGEIELDVLMALALTDDKDLQRSIWTNAPEYARNAAAIRRQISHQDMAPNHRLAIFVGLEAYQAAGGEVRRDLFSDDDSCTWVNAALVETLAKEKLDLHAAKYSVEGWAKTDGLVAMPEYRIASIRTIAPVHSLAMSDTEVADLATQEAALKRLSEAYDEAEWPAAREIEREMDRLETRISEFKKEFDVFLDDDMARSALYSYITDEGQLATLRGAPLSLDLESIDAGETSRPQSARQHQKERSAHSERLLRMLSAQRTMALQATIEQQPGLALVVLASRLATSLFYQGYSQSAVKVSASDGSFAARSADSGITESAAWNHMESASAKWSARLPGEASEAFAWFASQEQSVVIDFIAYCTAKSVDAVSASEQDSVGSDLARDVC